MSALHLAVEAGLEEEVERLLSSQTLNIDAQDAEGYTALHRAVINGDEKIVESLLAAGARSHERRGIPKRPNLHGPNALHFAAAGGHWHIMHLILDHEEEYGAITSSLFLNVRCSWQTEDEGTINTTPLLLAASGPSRQHELLAIKLLERLLRNEGQVPYGHSSRRGYTIIHLAAMKGHAELLKWALNNGGSVNPVADPGLRQFFRWEESPIQLAAQHGQIATAQLLLEHGEDVNSRTRGDKVTALHCAALSGKESMFHFLLEAGADPLGRCSFTTLSSDFENVTVAHLAAHANNVGILAAALELGADFGAAEVNGCTALHHAVCGGGGNEAIKYIVSTGKVSIDAVYSCSFPISLPGRLNLDIMDGTALHMACDSSIQFVRHLIEAGADVNFRTTTGYTPLHFLSSSRGLHEKHETSRTFDGYPRDRKVFEAAFRALIAEGADVNAATNDGLTPLHLACWSNDAEAVALLLELGANVTARTGADKLDYVGVLRFQSGFTPLHFLAISDGYISETVNIMTQSGVKVDLNAKDCDGNTPLHWVAWNADQDAINLEHYQGLGDGQENTAFLQSIEKRGVKLAKFLEAGADACQRNARGHTPLQHLHTTLASSVLNEENAAHEGYKDILDKHVSQIFIPLVAAGDFSWEVVPDPCPGLERALVAVWKKNPEELPQLFARLEPEVKDIIRECLKVLRRKMPKELCMVVLGAVFGGCAGGAS